MPLARYVVIHYGDILVSYKNILSLRNSNNEFSLLADKKWRELWQLRMSNYLEDIETFKTTENKVIELGQRFMMKRMSKLNIWVL